MCVFVLLLHT